MPAIPGLAARRAALSTLDAVLNRGEPLEGALGHAARKIKKPEDRALAHNIAAGVLRWMVPIDALIDGAMKKPLPADAKARTVLRIMLFQALALQTPPHAVIATSLPLLSGGPRRLAHGVFGGLVRRGAMLPERPPLPAETARRWRSAWGGNIVTAAELAWAERPPLDLTLRDPTQTNEWEKRLGGTSLMEGHVRLAAGDVTALEGYEEGAWWVQDLAASLPARLLGEGGGRRALDLCAAPGGKTLQLAAAGWKVTAVDRAQKRLDLLSDNLSRTGLSAETICADLLRWEPDAPAEAVLLDAPCSATGIFRRHPDVLYRVGDRQIEEMTHIQQALLRRAAGWTAPGGTLVYAVCSLERAEGEEMIDAFISQNPGFSIDAIAPAELPKAVDPAKPGVLRTGPQRLAQRGRLDGFFAARLRRSGG